MELRFFQRQGRLIFVRRPILLSAPFGGIEPGREASSIRLFDIRLITFITNGTKCTCENGKAQAGDAQAVRRRRSFPKPLDLKQGFLRGCKCGILFGQAEIGEPAPSAARTLPEKPGQSKRSAD